MDKRGMDKREVNLRLEIIKTLVEMGGPVTFKSVRTGKETETRQLVYYHLKKLVKEGVIISEKAEDGETYYICQPIFYDPIVKSLLEATVKASLRLSVNDQYATEKQIWKCLMLMLEMLEPDS